MCWIQWQNPLTVLLFPPSIMFQGIVAPCLKYDWSRCPLLVISSLSFYDFKDINEFQQNQILVLILQSAALCPSLTFPWTLNTLDNPSLFLNSIWNTEAYTKWDMFIKKDVTLSSLETHMQVSVVPNSTDITYYILHPHIFFISSWSRLYSCCIIHCQKKKKGTKYNYVWISEILSNQR